MTVAVVSPESQLRSVLGDLVATELSPRSREFLAAFRRWLERFERGMLEITEDPRPPENDYGLDLTIEVAPRPPGCARITLLLAPDAAGFAVDSWQRIAHRDGFRMVPWSGLARVGCIHLEPKEDVASDELLGVLDCIANGEMQLVAGILLGHLVWARGELTTRNHRAISTRIGETIEKAGLGQERELHFAPWPRSHSATNRLAGS